MSYIKKFKCMERFLYCGDIIFWKDINKERFQEKL